MGALLAKFRKEKTTAELLEKLETDILELEKFTINTQERKKRFVGTFLSFSIGIFVIAFIVVYFIYLPPTWKERIMYTIPMLLFPFVIILLRKLFTWYFQRKLNKNSDKLSNLRTEKKKIIEQVMDKETYKVAVNLLARYGGDKSTANKFAFGKTPTSRTPGTSTPARALTEGAMRSSNLAVLPSSSSSSTQMTPSLAVMANRNIQPATTLPLSGGARQMASTPQARPNEQLLRRRTPFPIVNHQEKGVLERIVDVLIGDGPQDRYAMICKHCFAHNGMALKEEFDYTTFRCAFCNALNPARKERPVAPSLPLHQHLRRLEKDSSDSDSSASDADSDLERTESAPLKVNFIAATPPMSATETDEINDVNLIDGDAVPAATESLLESQAIAGEEDTGDLTPKMSDELKKAM